jgi:hypothetical protein
VAAGAEAPIAIMRKVIHITADNQPKNAYSLDITNSRLMKKPPTTLGFAPMAAALRRYIMAGIVLLATTLLATKVSAQTYNYPVDNGTDCPAYVHIWSEDYCGSNNIGGYNAFTVGATSSVNQPIPTGSAPVKIYVTINGQMATWLCPNTSFSPASLEACGECSSGRVTIQGYTTATRIDCM